MLNNVGEKKTKNILLVVIILLAIILVTTIVSGFIFIKAQAENKKMLNNPNIYNNIFIQGLDMSNMSKEDANILLKDITLDEKITLSYKDKNYTFNKSDFGVTLNTEQALEEAYNIGRTGSEKERLKKIKHLQQNVEKVVINKNLNEDISKEKLKEISKDINIAAKNATLKKSNDTFVVIEGNNGLEVDFEKTYKDLSQQLLTEGDSNVDITVIETEPKYKAQDLNKIQDKLGSFSTKYSNKGGKDNNRIINMKVASERINGTILYPGEVFSTNNKFGSTTKANGYKPAPTILNGKFIDEYGGGVCQVSSTLYNAILYSELDIVERQNHSLKVGYLDYGFDATLAGDYIDLKFKNSTNYPIYIESYVTDNEVVCNVYGYDERDDNRELKFENVLVDVVEEGPKIVKETNELPEGEEKVEVNPLKGYKYKLYKLIYIDGKLQEKVLVNNSYYKPRAEEVLVGTKKVKEASKIEGETISKQEATSEIIKDEKVETTTAQIKEENVEVTTEEIIKEDIVVESPTMEDIIEE
ncbi:VanW family protein [uncultured Tyzzerella sp.]|uniref:VanW family protein n=1 Tax=uncultured Tyzzerella sp. TaxID=2321398 RepID=UPI0029420685|nr:VanW family protein [uncultured Tyzzerella sp.]